MAYTIVKHRFIIQMFFVVYSGAQSFTSVWLYVLNNATKYVLYFSECHTNSANSRPTLTMPQATHCLCLVGYTISLVGKSQYHTPLILMTKLRPEFRITSAYSACLQLSEPYDPASLVQALFWSLALLS